MAETTLSTETVFKGKIINVRVDKVALRNGMDATREVVEHRPCVAIVPIDGEQNVLLVKQYRYCVDEVLLEVPAGISEASETPTLCAQRELQEEIGYRCASLKSLGTFWTTPGFSDELMHAFLATGLETSILEQDYDEDITVEKIHYMQVLPLIESGHICDAKTIISLLMALPHIKQYDR